MDWSIIFYTMAAATVAGLLLGLQSNPRWYWVAAVGAWVTSFLGAFSIGLYTLVIGLIALALAIGHSLGLIKRRQHSAVAVIIGIVAWGALVFLVDDLFLFYPLHSVLEALAN